jgi:hypothetical protein
VDNNYLDLGMNKSGFIHIFPSGRLTLCRVRLHAARWTRGDSVAQLVQDSLGDFLFLLLMTYNCMMRPPENYPHEQKEIAYAELR